MTHTNYTKNILNIKYNNICFDEDCLKIVNIKEINTKVFYGYLTYNPECCPKCGYINESSNDTCFVRLFPYCLFSETIFTNLKYNRLNYH